MRRNGILVLLILALSAASLTAADHGQFTTYNELLRQPYDSVVATLAARHVAFKPLPEMKGVAQRLVDVAPVGPWVQVTFIFTPMSVNPNDPVSPRQWVLGSIVYGKSAPSEGEIRQLQKWAVDNTLDAGEYRRSGKKEAPGVGMLFAISKKTIKDKGVEMPTATYCFEFNSGDEMQEVEGAKGTIGGAAINPTYAQWVVEVPVS